MWKNKIITKCAIYFLFLGLNLATCEKGKGSIWEKGLNNYLYMINKFKEQNLQWNYQGYRVIL